VCDGTIGGRFSVITLTLAGFAALEDDPVRRDRPPRSRP
jgi:hypothetical protein